MFPASAVRVGTRHPPSVKAREKYTEKKAHWCLWASTPQNCTSYKKKYCTVDQEHFCSTHPAKIDRRSRKSVHGVRFTKGGVSICTVRTATSARRSGTPSSPRHSSGREYVQKPAACGSGWRRGGRAGLRTRACGQQDKKRKCIPATQSTVQVWFKPINPASKRLGSKTQPPHTHTPHQNNKYILLSGNLLQAPSKCLETVQRGLRQKMLVLRFMEDKIQK